jgi:hypothetical protein
LELESFFVYFLFNNILNFFVIFKKTVKNKKSFLIKISLRISLFPVSDEYLLVIIIVTNVATIVDICQNGKEDTFQKT